MSWHRKQGCASRHSSTFPPAISVDVSNVRPSRSFALDDRLWLSLNCNLLGRYPFRHSSFGNRTDYLWHAKPKVKLIPDNSGLCIEWPELRMIRKRPA